MTDPTDAIPTDVTPDAVTPEEGEEKTLATGTLSEPAILRPVEPESSPEPVSEPTPEAVATEPEPVPESGIPPTSEPPPPGQEPSSEQHPTPEEESNHPVEEEPPVEQEGGGRKYVQAAPKRRFRMPSIPAVRPFRTIIVLAVVILLLLLLILRYGLGGGGGELLPGGSESGTPEAAAEPVPTEEKAEEQGVRRELNVSFFPSATDPTSARELACNLDWTDRTTESQESRRIVTENMLDFEFELEKAIRAWRLSLGGAESLDIPVVAVSMTPFPGEGVFRKIEDIARRVDPKISILRLETPAEEKRSESSGNR